PAGTGPRGTCLRRPSVCISAPRAHLNRFDFGGARGSEKPQRNVSRRARDRDPNRNPPSRDHRTRSDHADTCGAAGRRIDLAYGRQSRTVAQVEILSFLPIRRREGDAIDDTEVSWQAAERPGPTTLTASATRHSLNAINGRYPTWRLRNRGAPRRRRYGRGLSCDGYATRARGRREGCFGASEGRPERSGPPGTGG